MTTAFGDPAPDYRDAENVARLEDSGWRVLTVWECECGDADLAKQIGALRKPTIAAWAMNHFVRTRPDDLAEFRSFAELLREAQRTLDADQLRVLGRERAKRWAASLSA